jgi:transcriptional antiterminator RfaH
MTSIQSTEAVQGDAKQDLAWYLAHCKPNAERVAHQNLENQDFNTFLPLQKVTKRKAQTFQTPSRPLFPGYIFVQIDSAKGGWRKINNTRGVARLVRFGPYPCPVPPIVMQSLFASCNEDNIFDQRPVMKFESPKAPSPDLEQK